MVVVFVLCITKLLTCGVIRSYNCFTKWEKNMECILAIYNITNQDNHSILFPKSSVISKKLWCRSWLVLPASSGGFSRCGMDDISWCTADRIPWFTTSCAPTRETFNVKVCVFKRLKAVGKPFPIRIPGGIGCKRQDISIMWVWKSMEEYGMRKTRWNKPYMEN